MKDEPFIESIIQNGKRAHKKVVDHFSNLSFNQFNWNPSPNSWSIAQCLNHLFISDNSYFSYLQNIIDGNYKMSLWEKYSPFTSMLGKAMVSQLQEEVKRKMKTNRKLVPAKDFKEINFIAEYLANLESFLDYIFKCKMVDLDNTIITSPFIGIITYNLRDAFKFLIQHEHRHINQAIRVKENKEFPKN
jgi:hypothetical protein